MKRQRKRLVPGLPHKPAGLRWSPFLGWHRRMHICETGVAYCSASRPAGGRGRRVALGPLP